MIKVNYLLPPKALAKSANAFALLCGSVHFKNNFFTSEDFPVLIHLIGERKC